jgi:CheY-like chemotaxis protein
MAHQKHETSKGTANRRTGNFRQFGGSTAPAAPPCAVLIVDPDVESRELYGFYLQLEGCEVELADDGREALAKALTRSFDAIVTETELPGFDGYQLCRLLRHDAATLKTPVLFVTAEARTSPEEAHAAGVTEVFVKPCLPASLFAALRRVTDPNGTSRSSSAPAASGAAPDEGAMRRMLSHSHQRGRTTMPPTRPPTLHCPICTAIVTYDYSYCGGVSARHPEQWDYVVCPRGCGAFEYRHRTRKLRHMESS